MIKKVMQKTKQRVKPSARNKMMDLLAKRDHSEKEIRQKLKMRFTSEEIDAAIHYGKENNWLPESADDQSALAQKFADQLHRKNKGVLYINAKLSEKGLPEVQSSDDLELEKAMNLVKNKYSFNRDMDREEKEKMKSKLGRFLVSRGFEMSVVRKVIYEKL